MIYGISIYTTPYPIVENKLFKIYKVKQKNYFQQKFENR